MKLLNEQGAFEAISSGLELEGQGRFAVAFWGEGASDRLGIDSHATSVEIVCNLRMGGTNPYEIEHLLDLGVQVSHCDDLHAKVYLFPSKAVIGSSNASSNGLAFQEGEVRCWIEANVLTTDEGLLSDIREWWNNLPKNEVRPSDLQQAKEAWERRRRASRLPSQSESLLQQLRSSPTFFDGKQVYLAVYGTPMDKEGETGLKHAQQEFGDTLDAFQDWPSLPPEGHLVCFWRGPRGGLSRDGLYQRRPNPPDRDLRRSTLQLCWDVDDVLGMRVLKEDMEGWRGVVDHVRNSDLWDGENSCAVVDLGEVARRFLGSQGSGSSTEPA